MKRKLPVGQDGNTIVAPESIEPQLERKRLIQDGAGKEIDLIRETREYELITPLFGGGTKTQQADPVSVIRVPSIRGQLRFWWRATRGGQFTTIGEMKQAEDLIWGSTEVPSAVIIDLEVDDGSLPETAYWMELNRAKLEIKNSARIAPYAAFPLQPDRNERKKSDWKSEAVVLNVSFRLILRFPKKVLSVEKTNGKEKLIEVDSLENEVMCALWAWETFGGIGGRTRRGFGALRLTKVNNKPIGPWPANIAKLRARLVSGLELHALRGVKHPGVPQISPDISLALTNIKALSNIRDIKNKTRENSITAWKSLIEQLQDFRQERYGGRFGKSKWPEPNEIRGRADLPLRIAEEAEDVELVHKFPRAVFGLPIVFHFHHDNGKPEFHLIGNRLGDEPSAKYIERLASPLILRPLACEDGKAVGLAMILQTDRVPPRGLYLKGDATNEPQPEAELNEDEAVSIEPLKGRTEVLEAFLNRLR